MTTTKSIFVATIGTRDLAFQLSSGEWVTVGDDQSKARNVLTQEDQVAIDLANDPNTKGDIGDSFRLRTGFFAENFEVYKDRLQPIIFGKLVKDFASDLKRVYLIATDQQDIPANQFYRKKDTCNAAMVIAKCIEYRYQIPVTVILLGEGENPSDFDAMVRWTKHNVWKLLKAEISDVEQVLISPKGGVGQFSEALRVTALTLYQDKTLLFCDFTVANEENRRGNPSPYNVPLSNGANYLWELDQQQALALLERHDYEAVSRRLKTYTNKSNLEKPNAGLMAKIEFLLNAGIKWNISDFQGFQDILGGQSVVRAQQWWWTAYEAAYLATVRLNQGNIVEAFFHSFRAFEGVFAAWGNHEFAGYVDSKKDVPWLSGSIIEHPKNYFFKAKFKKNGEPDDDLAKLKCKIEREDGVKLELSSLCKLFRSHRSEYKGQCGSLDMFWKPSGISEKRNLIFHQLQGMSEQDLWDFWAVDSVEVWESQILKFLNFITEQDFVSLREASLMTQVHQDLEDAIAIYQT